MLLFNPAWLLHGGITMTIEFQPIQFLWVTKCLVVKMPDVQWPPFDKSSYVCSHAIHNDNNDDGTLTSAFFQGYRLLLPLL